MRSHMKYQVEIQHQASDRFKEVTKNHQESTCRLAGLIHNNPQVHGLYRRSM